MANPMSQGYIAHTEATLAELRAEVAPYEAGTATAGKRQYGGEWFDITPFRIEQINREIAALENALARHKADHA